MQQHNVQSILKSIAKILTVRHGYNVDEADNYVIQIESKMRASIKSLNMNPDCVYEYVRKAVKNKRCSITHTSMSSVSLDNILDKFKNECKCPKRIICNLQSLVSDSMTVSCKHTQEWNELTSIHVKYLVQYLDMMQKICSDQNNEIEQGHYKPYSLIRRFDAAKYHHSADRIDDLEFIKKVSASSKIFFFLDFQISFQFKM